MQVHFNEDEIDTHAYIIPCGQADCDYDFLPQYEMPFTMYEAYQCALRTFNALAELMEDLKEQQDEEDFNRCVDDVNGTKNT